MGESLKTFDIVEQLKKSNKSVVLTNGCFDILHVGHIRYLQEAKKLGEILIVGVNSDSSVKKLKGPKRPVNKQEDRAEVLNALACVDYTYIFEEKTADKLIEEIKPNVYVKGGDYKKEDLPEHETLQRVSSQIVFVKFQKGYSTTSIIEKAN